ncbi:hypothetical protein ACFFRR_007372 [Megaselia abdita]
MNLNIVLFVLFIGQSLCNVVNDDIKAIGKSVNKAPIEEIAAKHFVFDPNFRKAVKFLKGSGLKELVKEAETKPEFNATLQYLRDNGLDTDDIIPWSYLQKSLEDIQDYNGVDTFPKFLEEVMNVLPQQSIKQQIKSYRSRDKEFENFFQAIKTDKFRSLVTNARKASSLEEEIRVLSENGIDIDQLINILFTIIAWG